MRCSSISSRFSSISSPIAVIANVTRNTDLSAVSAPFRQSSAESQTADVVIPRALFYNPLNANFSRNSDISPQFPEAFPTLEYGRYLL